MISILLFIYLHLTFIFSISFPESSIDCQDNSGTCQFVNLYQSTFNNGSFHLLITKRQPIKIPIENLNLGIGFLSPLVWIDSISFNSGSFDPLAYHSQLVKLKATFFKLDDSIERFFIPIFIHRSLTSLRYVLDSNEGQINVVNETSLVIAPLWENFMRTFYAISSCIFSALNYGLISHTGEVLEPFRLSYFYNNLLLNGAQNLTSYDFDSQLPFITLFDAIPTTMLTLLFSSTKPVPTLFRKIILGSSRIFRISELDDEKSPFIQTKKTRNLALNLTRKFIFKHVTNSTQNLTANTDPTPHVTIALRNHRQSRNILNIYQLITSLSILPVKVSLVDFGSLSLSDQLQTAFQTDILIAAHGAAMLHSIWMRPGSCVIELFPFGFRKKIYQNLLKILGPFSHNISILASIVSQNGGVNWDGVLYLSWQVYGSSFHKAVPQLIDWTKLSSRNLFRNQDLIVHVPAIHNLVKIALGKVKFFLHAPWEQLNNQVQAFLSACVLASSLNRTLVLPQVGHRTYAHHSYRDVEIFNVSNYNWKPFEYYFDVNKFLKNSICHVLPLENFNQVLHTYSLKNNKCLQQLLGKIYHCAYTKSKNIIQEQVVDYYTQVLSLPSSLPLSNNTEECRAFRNQFLSSNFERKRKASDLINVSKDSPIFLFGNTFRFINFGINYSLVEKNYSLALSNSPLYQKIKSYLVPRAEVGLLANLLLEEHRLQPYIAIHLRRGDYYSKCRQDQKLLKRMGVNNLHHIWRSCWQSTESVLEQLGQFPQFRLLYIATNDEKAIKLQHLKHQVLTLEILKSRLIERSAHFDLNLKSLLVELVFGRTSKPPPYKLYQHMTISELIALVDSNIWVLVEQEICSKASIFVGNRFSSFSLSIADMRVSLDKNFTLFFE